MELSAVILAGGHSERMGKDKASLMFEGQTFLRRIITQLDGIFDIYLSVGKTDPYVDCLLPHIQDEYEECGPMGGIQKALGICKSEYLFVTACDMPFIDSQFAFYLAGFLTEDIDAVIPIDTKGQKHVLGAIYHKRVTAVIESQLQNGDRRLQNALKKMRVRYIRIQDPDMERKLKNVNYQEEYEKLLKRDIPVISFVGWSNTGKTTLIEKIIYLLKEQGLRVGYIKHTHHEIRFPVEEKDSERMTGAGAAISAVVSSENALIVENRKVDINNLLQKMDDVDVILIEGYKQKEFRKIMVAEGDDYPIPLQQCMAVVSDHRIDGNACWFSRNDVEGIGQLILNMIKKTEE